MKKKILSNNGFTLVELLVVIVILGILSSIGIQQFGGIQQRAANQAHNTNLRILRSSAQICILVEGYPSDQVTWNSTTPAEGTAQHNWRNYLDGWPSIPRGSERDDGETEYEVTINTNGTIEVTPARVDF